MIPRIAFTPGEPAGIGPELAIKLASIGSPAQVIAVCDPQLLEKTAAQLRQTLRLLPFDPSEPPAVTPAGSLYIQPVPMAEPAVAGQLNKSNATYVLETLSSAAQGCLSRRFDALVTGPVHKGVINDAGIPFSGHTEFFADLAGVERVVMMLAAEDLRVALVTTHLPLKDVSAAITGPHLEQTITILHRSLRDQFRIDVPRIAVCGLNPHAGEGGHLGREEIEIIGPTLDKLRALGIQLTGPLPADTLFTPPQLARCDAVLAMYHDQGLPVLKFKGFGHAVNITLGLPFIRTSVDHGTALNIAGQGIADSGSLQAALSQAIQLVRLRNL
ncbi:4-hydroxythreonine-4-phosphate dehydrogenase PdxA [Microbulbifer thermotolerans]|uniref:4-hydroxythreonine-4-phosphate dehydrogenase n=1 Tax=Microbulbifer thermotolerans TaxID=252514 RepID=A0AB35I0B8_MICTH|nr:4-hydroxythreonine-4-phosphate dehydrogenase PdxA [Microbulbifer thermotolerans]MCX2784208.1 4-hydroxythreonine-4-phosphate dehydrogenase PdxA [Microbulbifer thermotolerans]MCX2796143.1 4-hydroxythreonine-4-phosphate dehydrogenase PdxA [Microbulbifer thermotolerans]MCX2803010.1 4-hydroxythreonine-4-phosphate dehydrogenase PdxA [Microbulbifer thermotolerans]SFC42411.1 4-hydroxythreonine-4-phosphate dehydrogenase [Microbulbifer thermotolerans]